MPKIETYIKALFPVLFFTLLLLAELSAQSKSKSTISGRITDAETGAPMFGVNLFLANTTIGSTTWMDGTYIIENIPLGLYDLIVSHIGYKIKPLTSKSVSGILNLRVRLISISLIGFLLSLFSGIR